MWSLVCCVLNLSALIISYMKRMIVYSLGMFFFLALVTGQSVQLAFDLSEEYQVSYLYHYINRSGFESALIFLLFTSVILLIISLISPSHRKIKFVDSNGYLFKSSNLILINILIAFIVFILIFVVVGWSFFVSNSRPGVVSGSTIFLVLLSIGLYPLLNQVICKSKIKKINIITAFVVIFVTLLFSRIHVIVYATIFFVAWFYSAGSSRNRVTTREIINLLLLGLVSAIIFFGMGTIRDTLTFVDGDWRRIFNYAIENVDQGILSVRYNYVASVEGMSGLAGAFTFMEQIGGQGLPSDFGINLLIRGIFQWIPGLLKDYTNPIVEMFSGGN